MLGSIGASRQQHSLMSIFVVCGLKQSGKKNDFHQLNNLIICCLVLSQSMNNSFVWSMVIARQNKSKTETIKISFVHDNKKANSFLFFSSYKHGFALETTKSIFVCTISRASSAQVYDQRILDSYLLLSLSPYLFSAFQHFCPAFTFIVNLICLAWV